MANNQLVKCPACGYENPPSAIHCVICEKPLPHGDYYIPAQKKLGTLPDSDQLIDKKRKNGRDPSQIMCPECGKPNPRGAYMCHHCGMHFTDSLTDDSASKNSLVDNNPDNMDMMHSRDFNETDTQSVSYLNLDKDHPQETFAVMVPQILDEPVDEIPHGCLKFMSWMNLRLDILGYETPIVVRPLEDKPMLVGRRHESMELQPQIDLTPYLTDKHGVSRRHALLRLRGTRLELQDLNSTNGTTINGVRFSPRESHQIRHQDILRIGQIRIRINFVHQVRSAKFGYTEELQL